MWKAAQADEELDETIKAFESCFSRDYPCANPKDQSLMLYMVNVSVSLMKVDKTFLINPVIYDSRLYYHSSFINSTTSCALSELIKALQKDFELANFAISARAST